MAAVRGRDTAPERIVRQLVHSLGYRFRLYRKDLPGTPDLVLARHRTAILVHGCFWHAHACRHGRREPRSNVEYWSEKRKRNRQRDREVRAALRSLGWRVLTVWQCQTRDTRRLGERIVEQLSVAPRPTRKC